MRKSTKLHNELNDWYSLFIWNRFGNTISGLFRTKNARVHKSLGRFFRFTIFCFCFRSYTFITCDFGFFLNRHERFSFPRSLPSHIIVMCLLCFGPLATASQKITSQHNRCRRKQKKSGRFFVRLCNLCALCAAVVQKMHLMLKANRFTFTSAPKTITTLAEDYRCAALFVPHFHMVCLFCGVIAGLSQGWKAVNSFTFIITVIWS